MSSPAPSSPPTWWQRCWARRRVIAAAIGAGLAVICPMLPPQAQVPCRAGKFALQVLVQLDQTTSSSPGAPAELEPDDDAGCCAGGAGGGGT